eukprot:scaffold125862_cov26-Prasinocladus_malaysianus.AAC.1
MKTSGCLGGTPGPMAPSREMEARNGHFERRDILWSFCLACVIQSGDGGLRKGPHLLRQKLLQPACRLGTDDLGQPRKTPIALNHRSGQLCCVIKA